LFPAVSTYAQDGLNAPVKYEARDSIVADIPGQRVKLYGEAYVIYEGIELKADRIEIDLKLKEVFATYSIDSLGNPIGKPLFTSDGEESKCDYMKYNFETKQGYIKEMRAQQDEGYIHMAEAKIHPNEQIHFKNGKFTTCENDTPHYHFKLTKAIVVPDKRVVTGPVFMKIFKIPTPLAAPFAFFPNSDSKKHGIIFPSFVNTAQYGFGLQDFGYYIPLGDYWETQFNGTIFTTGRWGLGNTTNYYEKYKYRGSVGMKFEQFRGRFHDSTLTNKLSLNWAHTQDPKAHPSVNFSGNINFKSDNNGKSSLETVNPDYFTNQFNSAIMLSKRWKTKKINGNASIKTSLQQNSVTQQYTINLPEFNMAVSRFDMGVLRKSKVGKKWYEQINVVYNMRAKNFISAPDSIFNLQDFGQIGDYSQNGVEHNTTVNANLKVLGGRFTLTPSAKYREFWNFQYEDHAWNATDEKIDTVSLEGFAAARELSFNANLVTNFYGLYKFKGKRETRFKHVATPNVGFSYRPDLTFYQEITSDTLGTTKFISPFATSLFKEPNMGESGVVSFSLANTLKMKTRDMKDTINESDKSINLVDVFSVSGKYDVFKDSFNLSNIALSFRTSKFLKIFSFQSSATLSPYSYDSLGYENKEYAWKNQQGVGRITTGKVAVNANFTSKNGRKKQNELAEQAEDDPIQNGIVTNPQKINFEIPWQLNISYNLDYRTQIQSLTSDKPFTVTQTTRFDGDFSINEAWKFGYLINFNLVALDGTPENNNDFAGYSGLVTNYNVEIWRNLHCWEASLQLGQYGAVNKESDGTWGSGPNAAWRFTNWTFLFKVNIKAQMFQDIKLEYNQPPIFF
jgi:hypothetical protein